MNKKLVIGIVVVVLIAAMIGANFLLNKDAGVSAFGGGSGYPVKVATIQKGDISSSISASGVIEEVEKGEVYFDTPSKVLKVLVAEGDRVTRGQKILEVDTGSLTSELEKLKTNKGIQELSLNSNVANSGVNTAQSAVKKAEKAYNDSKEALQKKKDLYSANAISKSDLEASEAAVKQL